MFDSSVFKIKMLSVFSVCLNCSALEMYLLTFVFLKFVFYFTNLRHLFYQNKNYVSFLSLFFFFGHAHGMQKFPGQGSRDQIQAPSSNASFCSDNAESLTSCTIELLNFFDFRKDCRNS